MPLIDAERIAKDIRKPLPKKDFSMDARSWAERVWDSSLSIKLGPIHQKLLNELHAMVADDPEGAAAVIAALVQQSNEEIE